MEKGDRADTEGSGFVGTVHVRKLFQGICCVLFCFFNSYSPISFVLFLFSECFGVAFICFLLIYFN